MKIKPLRIRLFICFLFLQVFTSKFVNAQLPLTLASPTTGEYSSNVGIVLAPGFNTSGPFHAYITSMLTVPLASAPSQDQNYIRVKTYKIPSTVELNNPLVSQQSEVIQYFDGLGRPSQTIQTKGSPTGNDVVQPVQYDAFGREALKFLPYAEQSGGGSYKTGAFTTQSQFYGTSGSDASVVKTTSPYSQTIFEPSPLNRVSEQGAPGGTWQPAASRSTTTGRTVVVSYGVNDASTAYSTTGYAVRLWNAVAVSGQAYKRNLTTSGNYDASQLYLKITKDENWTSADGKAGTMEEYTDKDGHIVLKRTFNTDLSVLSTYYVYDDLGNLSFVLPPGANPDAGSIGQTVLDQFCYQYCYDGRKRLIEKKIPGKDWEYMVYNSLDQIVLIRDGNQMSSLTPGASFFRYDALGRVVVQGTYAYPGGDVSYYTRPNMQALVDAEPYLWEEPSDSAIGYTSRTLPEGEPFISSYNVINYYDDYNFPGASAYANPSGSSKTKGLLTGTKTQVLGTSDILLTVNYYDEEGRVSKIYKQHYQSGAVNDGNYDEISNSYNFEGVLTASTRLHHNVASGNTTIATRYDYDHIGRKLRTSEKISADAEVILSENTYNEIGQLKSKALGGGLQTTGYAYNERGWLKTSTSPQFSFQLNYQDGTTPQFNGNISTQLWGAGSSLGSNFEYGYDKLNRLLSGVSTGMSEKISYDLMGNISTLNRDGVTRSYAYNGNMLSSTSGAPGAGTYQYDGNGNTVYDGRNGKSITYNVLNLPSAVSGASPVAYLYDGAGNKLRKTVTGTSATVTDYVGGIQYEGGTIQFIQTEEGIARRNGASYNYEYNLADHLGNVRYTFYKNPSTGVLERLQSDDYYPFGLRKSGNPVSLNNKYLYNGKELQDELGQYDYGARFYDPVIGRFNTIDPLAEMDRRWSSYSYGHNNPITHIDVDGMFDWYLSDDLKTAKWFDGSEDQEGYTNVGTVAHINSSGENAGVVNLNANGIATNASTGETVTSSISGNTQIINKENETLDKAGQVSDLTGALASGLESTGLTRLSNNGSLYFQTVNGGVFNGNQYVSTMALTEMGAGLGKYAGPAGYAVNAGQVGYGFYQDGYTFGSNTKVAAAGAVGGALGAWAGAAIGAKGGAAIGGAIGVFFFGAGVAPGAAIGGFIGGVGGAFAGGYYGSEAAKKLIR